MGPGIFLIAIMGCGDGDAECRQLRLLETQYGSRAECMAASEGALIQNGNVDYPTVLAQCVSAAGRIGIHRERVLAGDRSGPHQQFGCPA